MPFNVQHALADILSNVRRNIATHNPVLNPGNSNSSGMMKCANRVCEQVGHALITEQAPSRLCVKVLNIYEEFRKGVDGNLKKNEKERGDDPAKYDSRVALHSGIANALLVEPFNQICSEVLKEAPSTLNQRDLLSLQALLDTILGYTLRNLIDLRGDAQASNHIAWLLGRELDKYNSGEIGIAELRNQLYGAVSQDNKSAINFYSQTLTDLTVRQRLQQEEQQRRQQEERQRLQQEEQQRRQQQQQQHSTAHELYSQPPGAWSYPGIPGLHQPMPTSQYPYPHQPHRQPPQYTDRPPEHSDQQPRRSAIQGGPGAALPSSANYPHHQWPSDFFPDQQQPLPSASQPKSALGQRLAGQHRALVATQRKQNSEAPLSRLDVNDMLSDLKNELERESADNLGLSKGDLSKRNNDSPSGLRNLGISIHVVNHDNSSALEPAFNSKQYSAVSAPAIIKKVRPEACQEWAEIPVTGELASQMTKGEVASLRQIIPQCLQRFCDRFTGLKIENMGDCVKGMYDNAYQSFTLFAPPSDGQEGITIVPIFLKRDADMVVTILLQHTLDPVTNRSSYELLECHGARAGDKGTISDLFINEENKAIDVTSHSNAYLSEMLKVADTTTDPGLRQAIDLHVNEMCGNHITIVTIELKKKSTQNVRGACDIRRTGGGVPRSLYCTDSADGTDGIDDGIDDIDGTSLGRDMVTTDGYADQSNDLDLPLLTELVQSNCKTTSLPKARPGQVIGTYVPVQTKVVVVGMATLPAMPELSRLYDEYSVSTANITPLYNQMSKSIRVGLFGRAIKTDYMCNLYETLATQTGLLPAEPLARSKFSAQAPTQSQVRSQPRSMLRELGEQAIADELARKKSEPTAPPPPRFCF